MKKWFLIGFVVVLGVVPAAVFAAAEWSWNMSQKCIWSGGCDAAGAVVPVSGSSYAGVDLSCTADWYCNASEAITATIAGVTHPCTGSTISNVSLNNNVVQLYDDVSGSRLYGMSFDCLFSIASENSYTVTLGVWGSSVTAFVAFISVLVLFSVLWVLRWISDLPIVP
jgi:hypothetical protein